MKNETNKSLIKVLKLIDSAVGFYNEGSYADPLGIRFVRVLNKGSYKYSDSGKFRTHDFDLFKDMIRWEGMDSEYHELVISSEQHLFLKNLFLKKQLNKIEEK